MLLKQLSRYEEALECFESRYGNASEWVIDSMKLQGQALRDKLKPHEAGSKEAFETYCSILGYFLGQEDIDRSEVEYARKKLNENILQHINKLSDDVTKDDTYGMGDWLQCTDRGDEALELYDKRIEEDLEAGDLYHVCEFSLQKTYHWKSIGRTKDVFDCYNKIIQHCEKFESLDYDKRAAAFAGSEVDLVAERLAETYEGKANIFAAVGDMDKAIECIDHAIKLEREHPFETGLNCLSSKIHWLPDEAIKLLDEEIKAVNSMDPKRWYNDEQKKEIIQDLETWKNKLLKKLAK